MFPSLTNPHEIAAAGPGPPKRQTGKYKVPSPHFLYQAPTPPFGAATARAHAFVALGIQHAMRVCYIVVCGLPGSTVYFHIIS